MIEINAGLVGVFVTVLFAIIGLAVGYGTLKEKVSNNRKDIDKERDNQKREMEKFAKENKDEHERIYNKLDEVNKYIRNGFAKG